MPAKDFLDLEEKKNLQKALKEEERAEVRERIWEHPNFAISINA
jgi:hypothetical protein